MEKSMKINGRVVIAVMTLGLGAWIGSGAGHADAGVIFPVDPSTGALNTGAPATVSLFQNGRDVTDKWLPAWTPGGGGEPVFVVFNVQGVVTAPTSLALVPPPTNPVFNGTTNPFLVPPKTSAYPGNCTNYGSDTTADYDFNTTAEPVTASINGFRLTPRDCGGMAVVSATLNGASYTFIVPQDTNLNGIPDIWEAVFCPNDSCHTGREDNDPGPSAGSPPGDGIAAFDEYRGFIVSGVHISTDPRQRDLFVHLVNPQCLPVGTAPLTSTASLLGQPAVSPLTVFPTDGSSLFTNLDSLISGSQIHLLGYVAGGTNYTTPEWVDRFVLYSEQAIVLPPFPNPVSGFVYTDGTNLTTTAPADDRVINQNAVFPIGVTNASTGRPMQKGLRLTECVDTSLSSPFGVAGLGSPNGPDNALIYTARIQNYINNMITGGNKPVRYLAFQNGSWALLYTGANPATQDDRNKIISKAIQFYISMEMGHSVSLTPSLEGTNRTSYGYHHAPGTGSNLDQTITTKLDKSGFNNFYIPLFYNSGDQASFQLD